MFEEYDIVAAPGVDKKFVYEIFRVISFLHLKTGLDIKNLIVIHNETDIPGCYDSEEDAFYISEKGTLKVIERKENSQYPQIVISRLILTLFYFSKHMGEDEQTATKFAEDTLKQLDEELRNY